MNTSYIIEALGLFPSCIKSGEPWTETCEGVLRMARAELEALSTLENIAAQARREERGAQGDAT